MIVLYFTTCLTATSPVQCTDRSLMFDIDLPTCRRAAMPIMAEWANRTIHDHVRWQVKSFRCGEPNWKDRSI